MTKTTISRPNQPDEIRDLTAEEEAQRQTDISAETARLKAEADAVVAQEATDAQTATDKASARVKLKAEEYTPLTEAEADAITG